MLAHSHGQLWNASAFSRCLGVSAPTIRHYPDLLDDLYLVRQLPPFHRNAKKRLVKSPKVYIRDTGLLHAILGLGGFEEVSGHPALGASFEGFAIEQILTLLPPRVTAGFYRTHAGAEIDLVLRRGVGDPMAVEIKYTGHPSLGPGMKQAMEDLGCREGHVVTAGKDSFPLSKSVRATSLPAFLDEVLGAWTAT